MNQFIVFLSLNSLMNCLDYKIDERDILTSNHMLTERKTLPMYECKTFGEHLSIRRETLTIIKSCALK